MPKLALLIVPWTKEHDASQFTSNLVFKELPEKVQKRLPRYPESSGILLGRLGVDRDYSQSLQEASGSKPRLGEILLANAQIRCLKNSKDLGSALLVIDAEMPATKSKKNGARDPLPFYTKYGFIALTTNPRRLIKTMRAIAEEFNSI